MVAFPFLSVRGQFCSRDPDLLGKHRYICAKVKITVVGACYISENLPCQSTFRWLTGSFDSRGKKANGITENCNFHQNMVQKGSLQSFGENKCVIVIHFVIRVFGH